MYRMDFKFYNLRKTILPVMIVGKIFKIPVLKHAYQICSVNDNSYIAHYDNFGFLISS